MAVLLLGLFKAFSVFFCFPSSISHLSFYFSGCHFQSLLSSLPFPLLTHSELSIAASLPRFSSPPNLHSPLSCLHVCFTLCVPVSSPSMSLNLLYYFIAAFHFSFTPPPHSSASFPSLFSLPFSFLPLPPLLHASHLV